MLYKNGYFNHLIKTSEPIKTDNNKLNGLYVPSLLKELNNNSSHTNYSKKKNCRKNYGDAYGFPTNYPSKTAMVNSFAPVAVNLGPVNW